MDPTQLFFDEAFARRIAIGLLRDREAAEDLVQGVWLEVLEKPPRHDASPRGYLATLLRRLWLRKRRSEARREARERASVSAQARPGAPELVARAEIHQRTVAAVLALEEPYRSTVLLRFFEDLGPEEIAARERIPVETVRTRLKRALAQLRERLESEGRDWREEWLVALGGGTWPGRETAPGGARSALAGSGVAAAVAATVLVVWYARSVDRPRAAPAVTALGESAAAVPERAAPSVSAPLREARESLTDEPPERAAPAVEALRGTVTDDAGRPLSGVHVDLSFERLYETYEAGSAAVSDDAGAFACSLERWSRLSPPARRTFLCVLWLWKEGYAPQGHWLDLGRDGIPSELVIALSPGRVFSLRVVDAAGNPIGGVGGTGAAILRDGRRQLVDVISGGDGWIAVGLEPGQRTIELLLQRADLGFAYFGEHDLPAQTDGDVALGDVELDAALALRGRCSYPDGTPARALMVRARLAEPAPGGGFRSVESPRSELALGLAEMTGSTNALGRFELHGLRAGSFQILAGEYSTRLEPLAEGAVWSSGGPEIELVVPRHHLTVEVVGPDGRAIEEARVALTRLSSDGEPVGLPQRWLTHAGTLPLSIFVVEPGETLAVLAAVPGCASAEQRVTIPAVPFETALRLELPLEDRRATLVLQPSQSSPPDWRDDLCAPLSGVPLPGLLDLVPDADGRVRALPLGSYQARIEQVGGASPAMCALNPRMPVTLGEGETVLELTERPAARVRVLFRSGGTQPKAPLDAVHAGRSESVPRIAIDADALEGDGTDPLAWLSGSVPPSRGSLELVELAPTGERVLHRIAGLQPSAGRYLDLVAPAGPLLLRVELHGRDPVERELAPGPGETLEMPVSLDGTAPPK